MSVHCKFANKKLHPFKGAALFRPKCKTLSDERMGTVNERAGIRTPDNLIKSQVLYQLSYTPLFNSI